MSDHTFDDRTPPPVDVGTDLKLAAVQIRMEQRVDRLADTVMRRHEEQEVDIRELRTTVEAHDNLRIEFLGAKNDNGKFGNLHKEVSGFKKWIITALAGVVASVGTWAVTIYNKGQEDGALRRTVESGEKNIELLWQQINQLRAEMPRSRYTRPRDIEGEDQP